MLTIILTTILTMTILAATPARAEMYRCTDAAGRSQIQDTPCAPKTSEAWSTPALPALAAPTPAPFANQPALAVDPPAAPAAATERCVTIQSFASKPMEVRSSYIDTSWKAVLSNSCAQMFSLFVTFRWMDRDDFEILSDVTTTVIEANQTLTVRGTRLLSRQQARQIHRHGVHIRIRTL
jgi:hypothetical protein